MALNHYMTCFDICYHVSKILFMNFESQITGVEECADYLAGGARGTKTG